MYHVEHIYCAAQVVDVSKDTVAIRSIDWDRDRFDIEFGYAHRLDWCLVSRR